MSDGTGTPDADPFVGKITQKAILFGPDDRVLVTRVGDHWEPPGGTFEHGETLPGGLRRELREEVDLDARIGPPVDAAYGGWYDGTTGNPMVVLTYRCETDEREVTLNEEHDDYEWVDPAVARERLGGWLGGRGKRVLDRAVALDDEEPFVAREDPYEGTDVETGAFLSELARVREMSVEEFRTEFE